MYAVAESMSVFRLDPDTLYLHWRHQLIRLTKIEFAILEQLLNGKGALVTRQELLNVVWGPQISVEVRTVDSHVVRLRRKLRQLGGSEAPAIETVWGLGYRVKYSCDRTSSQ